MEDAGSVAFGDTNDKFYHTNLKKKKKKNGKLSCKELASVKYISEMNVHCTVANRSYTAYVCTSDR